MDKKELEGPAIKKKKLSRELEESIQKQEKIKILENLYNEEERRTGKGKLRKKKAYVVDFEQEPDYEILDDSDVEFGVRPQKLTKNIAIAAILGLIALIIDLDLSSPITLLKNYILAELYHDGFAGLLYLIGYSRICLIISVLFFIYALWTWKRLEDYKLEKRRAFNPHYRVMRDIYIY